MKKTLKRSLSLLLAITIIFSSAYVGLNEVDFVSLFAVKAKAATSGKTGECTWSLDGTVLTISGNGAMGDYTFDFEFNSDYIHPWGNLVNEVVIEYGVTSIGPSAFRNCTNLISITIPDSVLSIGSSAFYGCTRLKAVYITDVANWCNISFMARSSNPLYYAKNLYINGELATDVAIPDGVVSVPEYGFSCENITSITIPDGVTSIGGSAFYNCTSLTSITIPDSVTSIGAYAFEGCTSLVSVTVPNSVISIGAYAFKDCTSLGSITIPDSVTSIGDGTFADCTGLTLVTIGNSVTEIGFCAFVGCTSLTYITIPNSVTCIVDGAFEGCTSLTSITIPDSVTSIGTLTFGGCRSLASITIPDSVTSIGDSAFCDCTNLTSITIPDSVTSIGCSAFYGTGYYNNTSNWEDDVLYIGNYLINAKNTLSGSYTIKDGTKTIADYAFEGCTSLTSITIPDSVTSIGDSAFSGCTNLASITIPDNVSNIGSHVFSGTAYYNNSSNWENSVLYIGKYLMSAEQSFPCEYFIKEGTKVIASYAFSWCGSLISITIPDSVTSIGDLAFGSCYNLTDVYYGGTEADWANIEIGSGNSYLTDATIHYHEHSYNGEWIVDAVPTCTDVGSKHNVCSECGSLVTEEIPAAGHTPSEEWVVVDATCTEPGFKRQYCTVCYYDEAIYIETEKPTGHNIVDDVCLNCGLGSDWKFKRLDDGLEIVGYIGSDVDVAIPDSLAGLPVTSIGDHAFFYHKSLTTVIIPDSVTSIGNYAFSGCTSLTSITISDSVTNIGDDAFSLCESLTTITIPDSVTNIGDSTFSGCTSLTSITISDSVTHIGGGAFNYCESLEGVYITDIAEWCEITFGGSSANPLCYAEKLYLNNEWLTDITIPEGVTSIGNYAFYSCESITVVTIPDSVTSIGDFAFSGCTSLASFAIPDSVTHMGTGAFSSCTKLTALNVDENNAYYTSIDGILFSEDMTELVAYPAGKQSTEYTIPDSVTSVGKSAFYNCGNLTSVTIPDSVTSIGGDAFRSCSNLASIIIPDSVTSLGLGVFYACGLRSVVIGDGITELYPSTFMGCTDLTSVTLPVSLTRVHIGNFEFSKNIKYVFYAGTQEQWSKINLFSSASNLNAAAIHYEATGHTYGDWSITSEATCTEDGSRTKTCSVCSHEVTEIMIASGHNYVAQTIDSKHPHTTAYKCSFCEETKSEASTISDCLECSFTISAIDSSSYKLVSYIGTESDVVIPATYNGRTITTVANSCFKGNTTITSVKIEDGVTALGSLVFMNCASLEKVTLPASVTSIGSQSFYGFTGTIYCTGGSYAHEYAVANNIDYVLITITGTGDTIIDYDNFVIYTSVENIGDITELFDASENVLAIPTASHTGGNLEFYGTGTIITVFDGNEYIGDFTLVVEGDTNGDSVCDALDAAQVALVSNGQKTIDGAYKMAADSNRDDVVDIEDYQAVVNQLIG